MNYDIISFSFIWIQENILQMNNSWTTLCTDNLGIRQRFLSDFKITWVKNLFNYKTSYSKFTFNTLLSIQCQNKSQSNVYSGINYLIIS
jgi:hypothetical protein